MPHLVHSGTISSTQSMATLYNNRTQKSMDIANMGDCGCTGKMHTVLPKPGFHETLKEREFGVRKNHDEAHVSVRCKACWEEIQCEVW
jgi:hypothetical protein